MEERERERESLSASPSITTLLLHAGGRANIAKGIQIMFGFLPVVFRSLDISLSGTRTTWYWSHNDWI